MSALTFALIVAACGMFWVGIYALMQSWHDAGEELDRLVDLDQP